MARATDVPTAEIDLGPAIQYGVLGGVIASTLYLFFRMIISAVIHGPEGFWLPVRMIAGLGLGQKAFDPMYSFGNTIATGMMGAILLALAFGAIFGAIVGVRPSLARTRRRLLIAGAVYGLALWLVNFYAVAPALGWDWYVTRTNPWVEFFAHTLFFGVPLAAFLDWVIGDDRQLIARF